MLIRLSTEQEHRLLQWAGSLTEAEINADVGPSGYELRIGITPGWGWSAEAVQGSSVLDLGDVEVVLERK